jgi:hypothetical protein
MISDERRARWERRAVRGHVAYVALSAAALTIAGLILLVVAIASA